jgi:AcrR family transcriptional regulator
MGESTRLEERESSLDPAAGNRGGAMTADRILDEAEELFAEKGFAATTLRDVAARVGIRNPSLYNHFASKEALYAAVLARSVGPLLDSLSQSIDEAGNGAVVPADVTERVMRILSEHPQLPRLVVHETLSGGKHLTPMLREWAEMAFSGARRMVELTPGAGARPVEEVIHLVLAMYNVIFGYFTAGPLFEVMTGGEPLSREALERQTKFLREMVSALFERSADRRTDTERSV